MCISWYQKSLKKKMKKEIGMLKFTINAINNKIGMEWICNRMIIHL